MVSLILGFLLVAFTVFAVIPQGLDWKDDIVLFLKGGVPVFTAFVGIISVFIGIADIKDRKEAKKEELLEAEGKE